MHDGAKYLWVINAELASFHLLAPRVLRWLLEFGILVYPCKKHSFFRSSINMFSVIHSQNFLHFLLYACSEYLCNTRFLSAISQNFKYLGIILNEVNSIQIALQERIKNAIKTYFMVQNFLKIKTYQRN